MQRSEAQLREDALAIWQAGVAAVDPLRLLPEVVQAEGDQLIIGDAAFELSQIGRIVVVGGGKAGAGMAVGLERALGPRILAEKQVTGLLSVPADCLAPTQAIRLVAGRPAGVNEPRQEGAAAAAEMLDLVADLEPTDLCLCLLSGGGSALLPAPIDGVTLDEKAAVTRLLSAAGADIRQLNCVRKQLSRFKGGGLARACRAAQLVTLIISDVLGDPLDAIASGPTVENPETIDDALRVFTDLGVADHPDAAPIIAALGAKPSGPRDAGRCVVDNQVIANNAMAVDSAGIEAERRGYSHAMDCATDCEGPAEQVGEKLAEMALHMRDTPGPDCLITGGEPTVKLADPSIRGRGGRNQQLTLAALQRLGDCHGVALLSGGTDGEDGPTDAAGAWVDAAVVRQAEALGLDADETLRRNDAYTFFEQTSSLLQTGASGTNVCDVRVVVVSQ